MFLFFCACLLFSLFSALVSAFFDSLYYFVALSLFFLCVCVFRSLKNSHLPRSAPALGDFDSLYSLTHNASHGMRPDNRMHHNNYHINMNSTISDSESDSSSVYESSINGYNLEDISRNMALLREQSNLTNPNTNNNGNGINSALNNLNANNNSKGFKKIRLS